MKRLIELVISILSAVVIGAFTIGALHAQGGSSSVTPSQQSVSGASAGCINSASARCRRKPRSPSRFKYDSARCLNPASATCRRKPRSQLPSDDAAPRPGGGHGSLQLQGAAAAIQIDARQTRIADVLSALGDAFDIKYRSSIALDDEVNGTYAGSLRHVISRVLDGYNYAIREEDSKLDVIVFGKAGEHAVPAAAVVQHRHRAVANPIAAN